MSSLQPNPTDGRLKFILKTYGQKRPEVVMSMVDIIAHTVGVDDWKDRLESAAVEAKDSGFVNDLENWDHQRFLERDKWSPPTTDFATVVVAMVTEIPVFRERHRSDPIFPWIAQQLAKRPTGRLTNDTWSHKLRRSGTMLGQWYEATRPNLGQYDLDRAFAEAEEWSKEHGGEDVPQGKVVLELSDGWTAQELDTEEQLDAEGEEMQHCVGSYCKKVKEGRTTIYSLRDKKGHPHVTIEVARSKVQQIRGKQNAKPEKKYLKYVDEFEEWLKKEGVEGSIAPYLRPYVELMETYHIDVDEDSEAYVAQQWREATGSPGEAEEWMKIGELEPLFVEAFRGEDVTPEEAVKIPQAIHEAIKSTGEVPVRFDELISIARMAAELQKLAPFRVAPSVRRTQQIAMFDDDDNYPSAPVRLGGLLPGLPGHESTGPEATGANEQSRASRGLGERWPSVGFRMWDTYRSEEGDGTEWLYPAEEWLDEDFTYKDWEDNYVGPWFLNYFTPEQATEWWDIKVEKADLASALRALRVTPEMMEKVPDTDDSVQEYEKLAMQASRRWSGTATPDEASKAKSAALLKQDMDRYATVIAEQIAHQVDDAGLRRNPNKRTSKRRTSRSRS